MSTSAAAPPLHSRRTPRRASEPGRTTPRKSASARRRGSKGSGRRAPATPVYGGRFGPAQAERLLWRAGFGPRPGDSVALSRKGLHRAVESLTRPRGAARLGGPAPVTDDGQPIAPLDAWGHDHLWWLDRMVRSNQPLRERMTLIWHDWFATSNDGVGDQRLMIAQNHLLRRRFLGPFDRLLRDVTKNPAMLIFLSGNENTKWSPNENYARELMELFTLGAAARYSERDVREQARALTGWRNDYGDTGPMNFRFDPQQHDSGLKRVFGQRGRFDWRDSCRLCLEHADHARFVVEKLWSYFIPVPIPRATRRALEQRYTAGRYRVLPLVEAILKHPLLYRGPRMIKPPIVFTAGLLRARAATVTRDDWVWIGELCGQRLFAPPNVAGWNDAAWLDTGTIRARWLAARAAIADDTIDPGDDAARAAWDPAETAEAAVAAALAFWNNPSIGPGTADLLRRFAARCDQLATDEWQTVPYKIMRQNALRTLIATCPDMQTC